MLKVLMLCTLLGQAPEVRLRGLDLAITVKRAEKLAKWLQSESNTARRDFVINRLRISCAFMTWSENGINGSEESLIFEIADKACKPYDKPAASIQYRPMFLNRSQPQPQIPYCPPGQT